MLEFEISKILSMDQFSPSELILNPDGSVYHLGLVAADIPNLIFTVGDPDRVASVSQHFDTVLWTKTRREFTITRGTLNNHEVLVLSTGMGTDNIDIVLNELDAAVNIDPKTRTRNPEKRTLTIIRIGTSGAIDPSIPVGTLLHSTGALAFDALLPFYEHNFKTIPIANSPIQPTYIPVPSARTPKFEGLMHGITATLPGFYGPQGRSIQIKSTFKETLQNLYKIQLGEFHITNFEMETSGIYALSNLLGHEAHSFSALLANRTTNEFHPDPSKPVNELIQKVLNWATS